MITSFKRIVRAGFVGFWRNAFVNLTSVLVMTVALFMSATTLFSEYSLESALTELEQKVDINVYMVTTAEEDAVLALKSSLEGLPDVREVMYTSRENALLEFRERHKEDELTIRALEALEENPLSASLSIRAKETSQYESIAKFLEQHREAESPDAPLIDRINYYQNKVSIDRLVGMIAQERKNNDMKNIALFLVSIFVAFNTIRLVIHGSREEISVMRLVGASDTFISAPFIISGIMQGIVASVLVLILLYPAIIYNESMFYPFPFFGDPSVEKMLFNYYITDFSTIFIKIVGAGVVIGAVSSLFAIRRYLRV
jgi:cell division transport system permease protein